MIPPNAAKLAMHVPKQYYFAVRHWGTSTPVHLLRQMPRLPMAVLHFDAEKLLQLQQTFDKIHSHFVDIAK